MQIGPQCLHQGFILGLRSIAEPEDGYAKFGFHECLQKANKKGATGAPLEITEGLLPHTGARTIRFWVAFAGGRVGVDHGWKNSIFWVVFKQFCFCGVPGTMSVPDRGCQVHRFVCAWRTWRPLGEA
jgi:hypothetical protein